MSSFSTVVFYGVALALYSFGVLAELKPADSENLNEGVAVYGAEAIEAIQSKLKLSSAIVKFEAKIPEELQRSSSLFLYIDPQDPICDIKKSRALNILSHSESYKQFMLIPDTDVTKIGEVTMDLEPDVPVTILVGLNTVCGITATFTPRSDVGYLLSFLLEDNQCRVLLNQVNTNTDSTPIQFDTYNQC
jgi:hypothetical protein